MDKNRITSKNIRHRRSIKRKNEMKRQDDLQLIGYIGKYGCFFMCMVYWLTLVTRKVELGFNNLNNLWMSALTQGAISGDVNGDGDMDDANELLIRDKDLLLKIAGLNLKYLGSFAPDKVEKKPGQFYIGEFYNEWTEKGKKKSFMHFGGLNDALVCVYDPLGESNTIKNGKLITVRVFA